MNTTIPDFMALGIGSTLYSDQGFGVQVFKNWGHPGF